MWLEGATRDRARVERWLTWVRGFALMFTVLAVATTPAFPSTLHKASMWVLTGVFAAGTATIGLVNRRPLSVAAGSRLSICAMSFDAAVVAGFVFGFAYDQPFVTWSLVVVIPIEGALRFGWRGSMVTGLAAAAIFVGQTPVREAATGEQITLSATFYVLGLIGLVSGAMSVVVETWRRQERAYREQAYELAGIAQVKDRLIAVTSHEIRGALASIQATATTMRRHGTRLSQEQSDRLLGIMASHSGHLMVLVDDLLVSSRAQEDTLTLSPQWGELGDTVDVALSFAERCRRGHILELFVEPLHAEIDHERMAQVLRNLIENAFKYSPPESPVRITAERSTTGVVVRISDRGPGIPKAQRDELFEPFRRGPDAATSGEGYGIGLFVVSRIVSAANGSVDVRSSRKGTTFVVRIPCAVDDGQHSGPLGVVRDVEDHAEGPDTSSASS